MSNPDTLICLTPNVEKYRHLLLSQPSKRDVEEARTNITFLIGLQLDGEEKYNADNFAQTLPRYSSLLFVSDPPDVKLWEDVKEYNGGDSIIIYGQEVSEDLGGTHRLTIQVSVLMFVCQVWELFVGLLNSKGEDMQRGCTVSDYTITIGHGMCDDLDLNTNSLSCALPEEKPEPLESNARNDGGLYVYVSLGVHLFPSSSVCLSDRFVCLSLFVTLPRSLSPS